MKTFFLLSLSLVSCMAFGQQFEAVNYPGGVIYTADVFQGKLVVAGSGLAKVYDGSAWTTISGYNESLNTPHKSKRSARVIGNQLYLGADDFNTNGEGIIHVYDGTSVSEKQGNRQFSYNANKEILDFITIGDSIYTCDKNQVYSWNNTSGSWRPIENPAGLLSPYSINGITRYNNQVAFCTGNELYFLNGNSWDSLGLSNIDIQPGKWAGSVSSFYQKGNALYLTGSFTKITSPTTGEFGNMLRLEGSDRRLYKCYFGQDSSQSKLSQLSRIFVDDNGDVYVTGFKNPDVNDVHLMKFDGSSWTDLANLIMAGKGTLPQFPGSEIGDYNIIFKHDNSIFIGGRFTTIGTESINGLARFKTGTPSGLNNSGLVSTVAVYPVPALDQLTIGSEAQLASVCILNVLGDVVISTAGTKTVNVEGLTSGIYYLFATDHNGTSYKARFLKK